jgi:hypothetical protein
MAGTVILAGHYIDFFNMIVVQLEIDGLFEVSEIASVLSLGYLFYVVSHLNVLCCQKRNL